MKRHLLTRILSIALAFTILSSDISAYAASDVIGETTGLQAQTEEVQMEEEQPMVEQPEEVQTEEQPVVEQPEEVQTEEEQPVVEQPENVQMEEVQPEEVPVEEEQPAVEESEINEKEIIEVELEEVAYLVPKVETAATAIGMYSLTDGQVSLKDSRKVAWIDRLDLTDASQIRDFYDLLVEASNNDGVDDFLIDDSDWGTDYKLTVEEITGSVAVNLSNAADAATVKNEVGAAASECAGEILKNYSPYIIAVRDAFDRDHPEVFWLSGESAIGCNVGYSYKEPETSDVTVQAEYTVTISMILKGTVDGEAFDIRATDYQSQAAIEEGITLVNSACEEILAETTSLNDYEKIKYFNKVLTESNEYNTSDDLDSIAHDCRECVSAFEGRTGTAGPVCEAYARAMKVLCDKAGIPCVLVSGMAYSTPDGTGEGHMWNNVQLDGSWYGVDATWNDPTGGAGAVSGNEGEEWLFLGSNTEVSGMTFAASHPAENLVSEGGVAFTNGPELSTEKYVASEEGEKDDEETGDGEDGTGEEQEKTTYKVSLETNGGIINSGNITEYDKETGAILPTDVTKEGWIFVGWYENKACEGEIVKEIPIGSTQDKTFYAKWKVDNSSTDCIRKENGEPYTGYFAYEGQKYYANSNGILQSGWIKIGTVWRYFDEAGSFRELEYQTTDNYLYTLSNGNVSYFTNKTTLLKNSWLTYGGFRYYFDENGFAVKGWYEDGSHWYYAETADTATDKSPIGNVVKGVKEIDGKIYGFHASSYYRLTGWQTIDGKRYYFQDNGSAVVGWHQEGDYWYYADANGCMLKNTELEIDGQTYQFDNNYHLVTGWQTIGGHRYYFDNKGMLKTGMFQVGNYWYYAEPEDKEENGKIIPKGSVAKGLKTVETDTGMETYIFHSTNYYHLTGWQNVGKKRFYLDSDGKAKTGLFEVSGKTYYAEKESDNKEEIVKGELITGDKVVDGKLYIFHASQYYMLTGWQTISGKRYYIDENGSALVSDWYQEGDYWYYADENGHLVTTSKEPTEIDGKYYYFDSNYRLGTGWKRIGDKMYFFDSVTEEPKECHALDYTGELGGWLTITEDGRKSYIKTNYQVLTGWQTIDGKRYYFDSNGIMQTGLFQVGRYYYYAETEKGPMEGIIATGAIDIDGKIYGFHPTQYYRLTGWQTLGGERYYFQDDCSAVVSDWYREGNYYYYADEKGRMIRNKSITIQTTNEQTSESHTYYFDSNYRLATGWIKIGDDWRFFDNKDNYLERHELKYTENNGWITLNENEGRKSYFNATGSLLKGWQNIDNQRYYFDSVGIMETGEFKVGNYYYYAEPEDAVVDGVKIPQGAVAKGIKTIETDTSTDTYVFHSTGYYRLTGWQTVEGKRFYLDSDGKAKTGLFEVGGRTYYAEEASDIKNGIVKGTVVTGRKEVDKQGEKIIYVFHPTQYYMLTGWQTVSGKRYYINEDGRTLVNQWYQEGDYWYYAGADGSMAQGRTQIGDQWYYFDNNYRLSTGWKRIGDIMYFYDSVAEQPELCYELKTVEKPDGWVSITETKRSYIKSNYQVLTGWQTIGTARYYFDSTGIALTGEFQIGRYYYYANPTGDNIGALAKNTAVIDGKTYGFHPTQYYRLTGWQTLENARYYFNDDCSAATGWFKVDGYWYYAESEGKVQKDIVKFTVNGEEKRYYFDSNYRLTTGWVKIANQWRFFNVSDTNTECYELTGDDVTSGWVTLSNGKKSYIHSRNGILKGWQNIETGRYYFDNTGILQTGWFTDGTYWYYAQEDGCVLKDEQTIGGKTYYFNSNYRLTTGWVKIGAEWKFFNNADNHLNCYELKYTPNDGWRELPDGRKSYVNTANNIVKGWLNIGEHRYYFDSNGIMETDWFQVGNYYYYAEPKDTVENEVKVPKGAVAKGAKNIGGKIYGFHPTGYYRLSGWQTIGTERYYFDEKYQAVIGWHQEGDYWYYADGNGCMAKGLTLIGNDKKEYYFDNNYRLSTGWKRIDNKMYFFDSKAEEPTACYALIVTDKLGDWIELPNGKRSYIKTNYQVLTGWQNIGTERYYFDSMGILVTGEFQVGRYYYYAKPSGKYIGALAKNTEIIDGKIYGFHPTQYYRLTGWQTLEGKRYYFKDDCTAVVSDWYQEGNYYYYADANGHMIQGKAVDIQISNEQTTETHTYYFDNNYRLTTGWVKIGDQWAFFDNAENYLHCYKLDATPKDGWRVLSDGRKSYVNAANSIVKGWLNIGEHRYYFDSTGIMETGEFKVGNYYYYAEPKDTVVDNKSIPQGAVAKGIKVIGEDTYVFHPTGYYRLTGWQTVSGKRFFLDSAGKATTGLFETGGRTYYAKTALDTINSGMIGEVLTGRCVIGTDTYVFHPTGYYRLTGWQTINGQRYYIGADGRAIVNAWYQEGDHWYHADKNGCMAKGRTDINGKWYYFDNNYRLSTGWKRDGNTMYFYDSIAEQPELCYELKSVQNPNGWVEITETKRSYIKSNYQVLTGWQTIGTNRYYFDGTGIALTGEFQIGRYHYYAETSGSNIGALAKNAKNISGKIYGFHPTQYYRLTGWQTLDGDRYYFQNDCSAVTGWYQEGNYWYYAKSDGSMLKGEKKISEDSEYYYFDNNYRLVTGWVKDGTEWKFFDNAKNKEDCYRLDYTKDGNWAKLEDGRKSYIHARSGILKGWQNIDTGRYYFDTAGIMQTGWFTDGTYWYYAKADGHVLKDKQTINGKEYYFDGNYRLKTGWITYGTVRYHFNSDENPENCYAIYSGTVSKGWFTFDGKKSYFNNSLNPVTGWQTIDSKRYYFDATGIMQTDWFKVGAYWYYANSNGTVVNGMLEMKVGEETKTYYFNENYCLQTGWQTINGKKYYIEITETPENYKITCVGSVGAGWQTMEDGRIFYADSYGNIKTGWQTIDKQRYYFDATGILQTGWFTLNGKTYYAEETSHDDILIGTVAQGAKTIAKDANGRIGAETYVFHSSQYYMLSGFQSYGGKRYYLQTDGKAKSGWFTVGTDLYYGEKETVAGILKGTLAAGAKEIEETPDGKETAETYFFHVSSNYRLTGWQTVNGKRYYLDMDGTAQTGWFTVSGKIYYGEPETVGDILKGTLAAGAKEIEKEAGEEKVSNTYFFHASSNYRLTGWQTISGQRYYLNTDGTAQTGWFTISGKTYYAEPATKETETGKVLKGTVIKGKTSITELADNNIVTNTYYFHTSQYYMLTGWQTIDKQRYYFNADGEMEIGWFEVGGYYYYADTKEETNGIVLKGLQEEIFHEASKKNQTYYFDTNYRLKTGWQTINGKKYFFENAEKPEDCYKTHSGSDIDAGWFKLENGQICYADTNGNIKTGWQTIDKQRYYFDANGVLQTDWFKVGNHQYYGEPEAEEGQKQTIPLGAVASGIKEIDGETYCFHTSQYYMLTGWQTINKQRFYLEADETAKAKAKTGWFTLSGKTYYAEEENYVDELTGNKTYKGTVAQGAKSIKDDTYVFHSSQYYMLTGFQSYSGKRYYLQSDGTAKTGWFTVGTDLYYGETEKADGILKGTLASGAKDIKGDTYFFHTTANYRLTGWQTVNGQRYYLNADGIAQTGWFTVSGKIYYGEPVTTDTTLKGTLAKGAKEIDGETYVFHPSSYYRLTGWQTVNGQRYYLQSDGTAKTGWFTVSNKSYYAEPKAEEGEIQIVPVGVVASGIKEIGDETYCFHTSQYYMLTGWQTISGQRFYLNADGKAQSGWFTLSGKTYYAEEKTYVDEATQNTIYKGTVAKGAKSIEGDTYVFHSSQYYMLTGFQSYGGKRYYLQSDGTAKTGWFTVGTDLYYGEKDTENGLLKGTLASGAKEIVENEGMDSEVKNTYFFHTSANYRLTGWQTINGQRYYLDTDGIALTGWFTVSGKIYYGEPSTTDTVLKGTLAKGAKEIERKENGVTVTDTYVFHSSSNYRLTGWQTVNGQRYYLDKDGKAKTNWFTISGKTYYAEPVTKTDEKSNVLLKGTVAKGLTKVERIEETTKGSNITVTETYYFHPSQYYKMAGWQTISSQRYYFDADGIMETGWFEVSGYHYYANQDGTVVKGLVELPYGTADEKKTYYFDGNYRLKTGWQTVSGKKYFFENSTDPAKCYATVATYEIETGWFKLENGQICYANSKGVTLTGWQTIDKQRYYFDANGVLQTDWFKVGNYQYYGEPEAKEGEKQEIPVGAVASGIKEIGDETYCFHTSQYYMLTGWQTVSGQRFYLEADETAKAKAKIGWFTLSGKTYYAEESTSVDEATKNKVYKGTVAKGAKSIAEDASGKTGTETYVFHSSQYYMLTGFQSYGGKRYYLQPNGKAKTGWFTVGTDLYYGEPTAQNGALKGALASGAKEIVENEGTKDEVRNTYFFHTTANYRLTGWQTVNGQRYYLNTDGTAQTKWFTVSGKIYYGEPETTGALLKGTLAKGVKEINNQTYVFHSSQYYRLTGWQTVGTQRYYLNTNGTAKTGWFTISGKTYYAQPEANTSDGTFKGTVAKGLTDIDKIIKNAAGENITITETYYFHPSQYYKMTGWQTIGKDRYYFNENGVMETGWFEVSGYDHYANSDGTVVKGLVELPYGTGDEKKFYYFDNNYRLKTGWHTISGKKYFFTAADTPEECYATYEGSVSYGWMTMENGQICYADSRGNVKTGWQTISGQRYYFDANGILQTGWFPVGNYRYYAEPKAKTGEEQEVPIGAVANGIKEIDDETYIFHSTQYYPLTGFQSYGGKRYYLQADGTAKNDWFTVGTNIYYGEKTASEGVYKGTLASGAKEIEDENGKETYFFHTTNNNRLTGWQTVGDKRYYLQADGKAKTGWFNQGGYWYYGAETAKDDTLLKGGMEKDLRTINVQDGETTVERTYYFDTNYRLATGWKVIKGIRYFFQIDENPINCYMIVTEPTASGWYTFNDGTKSYFNAQGNPVTDWQTIDGKKYYFDINGIMQTGWCTINGVEYFFNADGIYIPMTTPTITSLTSTSYGTVDVKWNLVSGVQKYILEYSTDNVFPSWKTVSIVIDDTTVNSYRVEDLEEDTTYYFRLRYTTWSDDAENTDLYYSQYSAVKSIKVRGEVAATATSATLSDCQIISGSRDGGITVQLKATLKDRLKSADDQYYIVETESYGNAIDLAMPVGSVDKAFDIDTTVEIGAGDGSEDVRDCVNRALMNKFALAILKEDGNYQVISTPMGITNPEFITENTKSLFEPISKKGLQGIGLQDAAATNSKNTLFNLDLAYVVGTGPADGYVEYEYKGKTYYFSECSNLVAEFKNMRDGYDQYIQEDPNDPSTDTEEYTQVCITLNLLLSYNSSNSYLIDPAARTPGHSYYTMNMREEKARETFEAVFLYLGELFGTKRCFVTHWVLGNEVNSSRAWNYQGSLSFDAYMQSYTTAFRLLYNGVKAAKSGNNIYISLDNGWTAAPDTYAGKTTLDKFAALAQKENPDMLWSIAYHGYSYPLTRCDFWNDYTYTTDSISTRYISMRNIYVLTNYAATLEQQYNKPEGSIRVILSEQGYNAGQGSTVQAQALARGYYMAEFNDRIDAFIIRAIVDDWNEISGGLYLGIQNVYQEKRTAFYVYEYMDSSIPNFASTPSSIVSTANAPKFETAKSIICNTNWESIIPNFDRSKLAGMY